jgi:hypothetical protein
MFDHNYDDDIRDQLAAKFMLNREQAILSMLPEEDREIIQSLPIEAIAPLFKQRGQLVTIPDGTQTFYWDGEPLLRFSPMTFSFENDKVVVRQKVKNLKEEPK